MALQNSKLALVFAALDPERVKIAFSQIPMEELRGIIKGMRRVMGSSGWLKWFETREGITTKFCKMLADLKITLCEQLRDSARVRAAYRFLQRDAPDLGNMLVAWSDEAFRMRPRGQSGGRWGWLRRIKTGVITFLRVVHLAPIATWETVLYVPVLVCKLVYRRDGKEDDRWKTSRFAWPFFANQVTFLEALEAYSPEQMRRSMRDLKKREGFMESRFMHANRGRQFASLAEYQRFRQEWIAANTGRYMT